MTEGFRAEQFSKPRILKLLQICAVDIVRGYLQKNDQYSEEVKRLYLAHANNLQTLLNSVLETKDLGKWSKEFLSPLSINPILIITSDNITRLVDVGEMPYPKTPEGLVASLENIIKLESEVRLEENQNLISLISHFGPLSSQVLHELKLSVEAKKRLAPMPYEIKQKCLKALKSEADNPSMDADVVGQKVDLFTQVEVFTSEEWENYLFTHKYTSVVE